MKRTIREKINAAYSLHDLDITSMEMSGGNLIVRTDSGLIRLSDTKRQVDGYVEFNQVDWGYCYIYLFDFTGNVGPFGGEKKYLISFLDERKGMSFSVMDEVFGHNQTKFFGHLLTNGKRLECIIEIYHEGDMVFVEE
ncbi:MAG: hypothetical protein IJE08_01095 [Clostridia bacterium]|nr:hypothetical protein [Clostridia bacterium]